jgi:hypothetical protein
VKKSFDIQELLELKSKCHGNQTHAPLLIKSFPKTPRTRSEASWFGGSHNYKTNKQPSFIDRYPWGHITKQTPGYQKQYPKLIYNTKRNLKSEYESQYNGCEN